MQAQVYYYINNLNNMVIACSNLVFYTFDIFTRWVYIQLVLKNIMLNNSKVKMKGGIEMNEYESISKKVNTLLQEKSEKKTSEKNQEMKKMEEYKLKREKISQKIMGLELENKIN